MSFRNVILRANFYTSILLSNSNVDVCKRILATEGERVLTTRGQGFFQEVVRTVVPSGHVWLAGDNVENSTDSRNYGPVPIGLLQGRVFVKFGPSFIPPFTRIGREIPVPTEKSKKTITPAPAPVQRNNSLTADDRTTNSSGNDRTSDSSSISSKSSGGSGNKSSHQETSTTAATPIEVTDECTTTEPSTVIGSPNDQLGEVAATKKIDSTQQIARLNSSETNSVSMSPKDAN